MAAYGRFIRLGKPAKKAPVKKVKKAKKDD